MSILQLPCIGSLVMADEICVTVRASQFEVSVVGRQPRVENIGDDDAAVAKNQCAWRLLAAMAGVTLDADSGQPLFIHPITIRP
jgi:hypothetical protein